MYNTKVVLPLDRVKTRSGRHGIVRSISSGGVAYVVWDDGEDFPIKFCHLEVLAHGARLPDWYLKGNTNDHN